MKEDARIGNDLGETLNSMNLAAAKKLTSKLKKNAYFIKGTSRLARFPALYSTFALFTF